MCTPDAPDPPEIKIPQYLRNPFLDADRNGSSTINALRIGRSSLKVPLDNNLGIGFSGRSSQSAASPTLGIQANRKVSPGLNLTTSR